MDLAVFGFRTTAVYRFLFFAMINFNFASSTGPISMRCYCNLPECGDNYSCKSRSGCFQELPHYNLPQPPYRRQGNGQSPITPISSQSTDLRYGCLELWPSDSAPFQCTEPGIRKSPLVDGAPGRRHASGGASDYDSDESGQFPIDFDVGRSKFGDRSISRRRPGSRHNGNHKAFESRRWSAYDVPLRCCFDDMCNRRRIVNSASKLPSASRVTIASSRPESSDLFFDSPSTQPPSTGLVASHQQWWFTSTMILVPVTGCITLLLLVAIGCWILNFGSGSSSFCRRGGDTKNRSAISIPAGRYFCYQGDGASISTKLINADSSENNNASTTKSCNCVVVAATTDLPSVTGVGQCVHIPIFLSKYNGDCVVNVKPRTDGLFR